jgi:hypothetical protein
MFGVAVFDSALADWSVVRARQVFASIAVNDEKPVV